MTIITLTTDFGLADAYAGIIKGVILGIAPAASLVDLSHDIAPQNVRQAAYVLASAAPFFPPGTIHLVVVDPGVGAGRRPLVATDGRAWYVGPDNGVLSHALAQPGARAYHLDRPHYWLPEVSHTFHGRDVFAPAAAHLARGVPAEELGSPVEDAVRLALAGPARLEDGRIAGQIVYTDRFGNLITDIPAAWVGSGAWQCHVGGRQIAGLSSTYADVPPGALLALVSSGGTVEIAVRGGSAAGQLGLGPAAPVTLWPAQ